MQMRSLSRQPAPLAQDDPIPGPVLARGPKAAAELVDYLLDATPTKSRLVTTDSGRTVIHYRNGASLVEISPLGEPFESDGPDSPALFEEIQALVQSGSAHLVPPDSWNKLLVTTKNSLTRAEAFLVLHMPCRATNDIKLAESRLQLMERGLPQHLRTPEFVLCCEDAIYKDLWAKTELLIAKRQFSEAWQFANECEATLDARCQNELNLNPSKALTGRFREIKGLLSTRTHRVQLSPKNYPEPTSEDSLEPLRPPTTMNALDISQRILTIGDNIMCHRDCILVPISSGLILMPLSGDVLEHSLQTDRPHFETIRDEYKGTFLDRHIALGLLEQARLYAYRAMLHLYDNDLQNADLDYEAAASRFSFVRRSKTDPNEVRLAYQEYSSFISEFILTKSGFLSSNSNIQTALIILNSGIQSVDELLDECTFEELVNDITKAKTTLCDKALAIGLSQPALTALTKGNLELLKRAALFRERYEVIENIDEQLRNLS